MLNILQQHSVAELSSLHNQFIEGAIKQLPAKVKDDSSDSTTKATPASVSAEALEADFIANLTKYFSKLQPAASVGQPTSEPSLFDNLSLVDNEQLEENIIIDSMVARANTVNETPLRHLNRRLKEIISPVAYDDTDNPIRPRHIATSFVDAVANTELAMNQRLALYKVFESAIMHKLDSFYQGVNDVLKQQGVLSDLPDKPAIKKSEANTTAQTEANKSAAETSLQIEPESSVDNAAVVATLRELLTKPSDNSTDPGQAVSISGEPGAAIGAEGTFASGPMPVVDQPTLLQTLSSIQQTNAEIANIKDAQQQILQIKDQLHADIESLHTDERRTLGHDNENTIDIVSMLFDFIFDDHSLPDEIKVLLGRLQIPIIKVALVDNDFLDNTQHPARRLINTMAKACVGWTPDSGVGLKDKVAEIVNRVITEYEEDSHLFNDLNQDFIQFYEELQKRAVLLERRLQETEAGKAQQEEARLLSEAAIVEIEAGYGLPEDIKTFLNDDWQRLLMMIVLREGHDSDSWQSYVQTGKDLTQSLHPVSSQSDIAIHKLKARELIANLHKGLDIIGYDEFELESLQQVLTAHHEKVRQGEEVFLSKPPVEEDEDTPVDDQPAELVSEEPGQQANEQSAEPADELLIDDEFEPLSDDLVLGESVLETPEDEQQDITIADSFDSIMFDDDDLVEIEIDDMPEPDVSVETAPEVDATPEQPQQDDLEQYLSVVKTLQAGCWFTYMSDGVELRCKLAAVLPTVGKYIFVNNTGRKVSEYRTDELALALREQTIVQIDDSALFERALQNIVTTFQEKRQREELE